MRFRLAFALGALLPVAIAAAQQQQPAAAPVAATPAGAAAAAAVPQETVTESLIRLLAEHNAIPRSEAEGLIKRLQAEQAAQSFAPAPAAGAAAATVAPGAIAGAATVAPGAAAGAATAALPAPAKDGAVRVFYVPESEKKKIREEIRQEVMQTAREENWAQPDTLPTWTQRISLYGDIRLRQEWDRFDSNNTPLFFNYNALNSGAPFNVNFASGAGSVPIINNTANRTQQRYRVRLGLTAAVSDDLSAVFRLSSGSTTNPVSTNQTANSFNKGGLNVERAFLNWRPVRGGDFWIGRMQNPMVSTEMVFDEDLNFDGVAARYLYNVGAGVTAFATLGGFAIEDTVFDISTNDFFKAKSRDKSLFAAQLGAAWKGMPGLSLRGAVAYYDYNKLVGVDSPSLIEDPTLPSPRCGATTSGESCPTDNSRPAYTQKGNTMFKLRHLSSAGDPLAPEFQYFGYASQFRIIDVNTELNWAISEPLHVVVTGDFAANLAYDWGRMNKHGLGLSSNIDHCPADPTLPCELHSGSIAWLGQILLGYPQVTEAYEWNVSGSYRRVAGDSLPDAFVDSDFHLGGTNARGYTLAGTLGFTHFGSVTLRWLSSTELTGYQFGVDTIYLDFNARF